MKLWHVAAANKNLGPGTPLEMIVREESAELAIEAVIQNGVSPFDEVLRFGPWHSERQPKPTDFHASLLGEDAHWKQEGFSDALRDPKINTGPTLSADENQCRLFMKDRIVMMRFTSGGMVLRLAFAFRLYLARKLREIADWIDEKEETNGPEEV